MIWYMYVAPAHFPGLLSVWGWIALLTIWKYRQIKGITVIYYSQHNLSHPPPVKYLVRARNQNIFLRLKYFSNMEQHPWLGDHLVLRWLSHHWSEGYQHQDKPFNFFRLKNVSNVNNDKKVSSSVSMRHSLLNL